MFAHGQWLLLQLLAASVCRGQLTIFAAPLLAQRFASEAAEVDLNLGHIRLAGTAAVLGWPRYGDICEGPLRLFDVETNCTLGRAVPPQTTPWIAVLRLGRKHGCPSLATALRRVEADVGETICGTVVLEADAGALPELLPGDAPASFVPVLRRPAASAGLAAALEEAEAEGLAAIRGELRWGQPLLVESLPSKSLPIEFWLNPASAAGRKQLRAAAVALRPLRQHLTWQIHWPVTWRANSSEKATEFCISGSDLTSFDAAGFVCMASGKASDSAAALLEEAAHLRCVEDGDFEKAMRWEYLERTFAACEDGDGTASCSARQLQALGDKRCVPNNFTAFVLSEARKPRPWPMGLRGDSPDFAVRIAGWAFGGMPEAEAIFEAVCAVLRLPGPTKPSACGEVWHWRAPGWFLRRVPLWPHSCLSLLLSFLLPFCWPAFRRECCGPETLQLPACWWGCQLQSHAPELQGQGMRPSRTMRPKPYSRRSALSGGFRPCKAIGLYRFGHTAACGLAEGPSAVSSAAVREREADACPRPFGTKANPEPLRSPGGGLTAFKRAGMP
eukprot:s1725_g9.t1